MKKLLKKITTIPVYLFLFAGQALAADTYPVNISPPEEGVTNFGKLITSGIRIAMIAAGLLTFAFLLWGGLQWIMSGGDKTKYEAARDRITAALIGLAIVAIAWAFMKLVEFFFGINVIGGFGIPTAGGD